MNTISAEKMALYRATAQRRAAEEKEQNYQRFLQGWAVAAKAYAKNGQMMTDVVICP